MAPDLIRQNPSLRGPSDDWIPPVWNPNPPPTPVETRETVWDWWGKNGEAAGDMLQTGLCAIFPKRPDCMAQIDQQNQAQARDDMILYVLIGLVAVLVLFLIFKK